MGIFAEVSGWFGALIVLVGFACFSLGWFAHGRLFQLCNLVGSAALIVNGWYHGAWPSVALNVAWGTIAAVALARLRRSGSAAGPVSDGKAETAVDSLVTQERRSG